MTNKFFKKALQQVQPETRAYVGLSMSIAARIDFLLKQKGWSGADLARALDKSPSEISRWLSGTHNFTLDTLAKLETALGAPIFQVETAPSESRNLRERPAFSIKLKDETSGAVFEGMVQAV